MKTQSTIMSFMLALHAFGQHQCVAAVCNPTIDYVHTVGQIDIQPTSSEVFALQSWNAQLFAGGNFASIDQANVAHIAQWDGSSWSVVGSSANVGPQNPADFVYALTAHQGSLYVGGSFSLIGQDTDCGDGSSDLVRNIATWNGVSWSPLIQAIGGSCQSLGPVGPVRALLNHDFGSGDTLFVGGDFGGIKLPNPDPNGAVAKTFIWGPVVAWRGGSFSRIAWDLRLGDGTATGGSVAGKVHTLAVYDDGNGEKLYVAGVFNRAYNCDRDDPSCTSFIEVRSIAALDMQTGLWSSVGGAYLGNSIGGDIRSLQVYDDGSGAQLYAGGLIDEITNCRFDMQACPVGTTTGNCCSVWDRRFANGIARFDGQRWQNIGGPTLTGSVKSFGPVNSLTVYNTGDGPKLIAGGEFLKVKQSTYDSTTVPANSIAQFDATGWKPLDGGGVLNISNSITHVHATISHGFTGTSPLLYIGGRFDQTGTVFASPPPANLASNKVVAWGIVPSQLDSDNDTFINDCDNCQVAYNPDQLDRDGDGLGDVCDPCPDITNVSIDLDCNGVPDSCEIPAIDGPTTITDTHNNVLWTLVYDPSCQGRLIKKYRGTDTDHIRAISYCYDVEDRLDRICEIDTLLTPDADADATCIACNRGQEMVYDPLYAQRLVGSRDFVSNCSCSSGATFTYLDALDRVEYITSADQSGGVRPYGTILEQFTYVANTDRIENHFERKADGTLTLIAHYTYTDSISTCTGGTSAIGGYELLLSKPINDTQSQLHRECYDSSNRLVEICTYDDLFAFDATDTGSASPIVTTHQYTFTQANETITSERHETIHPSGYKDVREWTITSGTINTSGSQKSASTFRESAGGQRINQRTEVSIFTSALNRYRLDHVIEPTGLQTFFDYDPNYPNAQSSKLVDAPTGMSTYGQTLIGTQYDPIFAGRVSRQEKLGPNGVVTTAFEYDIFGRLTKTIENVTGTLNEQLETRFIYNGFDDLILSGRALEPGPEPKRQLVQATVYNRSGTIKSELACAWDGTLNVSTFDVSFPPCQLFQQRDFTYDSSHGRLIEESDIYGDVAPFNFYFIPAFAPRKLTHYLYDDTGRWELATGIEDVIQPSSPTGDSFDWFEYDNQSRITRTRHGQSSNGLRPVSEISFNGRGLPASQVETAEFTADKLITTTLYNNDGAVASIQQPNGSYEIFEYDEFGRMEIQKRCDALDCTGPFTIIASKTYDAASRVTQTSVSDVSLTQTDYDNFDRPFRVRRRSNLLAPDDNNDAITLTQYNPNSSIARVAHKLSIDPSLIDETLDLVTINTFDNAGRLLQIRTTNDDHDEVVDYTYDFSGNRISSRRLLGDLPDDAVDSITYQTYNALGKTIKTIDPEGHYSSVLVDGFGRHVLSMNYQDGDGDGTGGVPLHQQRFAYFHHGGLSIRTTMLNASAASFVSATTDSDQITTFEYDSGYRSTNSIHYNANTTVPLITTRALDDLGRVFSTTDPKANVVTQTFDATTGLLSGTTNIGITINDNDTELFSLMTSATYEYDGLGRRSQTTWRQGAGTPVGDVSPLVTTVTFDEANRQKTLTDPDSIVSQFDYDLLGRLTKVTQALGTPLERSTTRSYDRLSRLTSVETIDAGQIQRTEYKYDRLGRRIRTIYPDSANPTTDSVNTEYDRAGRMIHRTDQNGQVIEFSYDKKGALRFKNICDPVSSPCQPTTQDEFTYDGMGRMISATRRAGSPLLEMSRVEFSYNDLSQLISETQTVDGLPPKIIFYTRDQLGNRMSLDCPGVVTTCLDYDYDALSRTTTIERQQQPLVSYVYEWTNQLKRRSTVLPSSTPITFDIDYDGFRRPFAHTNLTNWPIGPILTEHVVTDFNKSGNPLAATTKITNTPATGDIFSATITHNYDNLRRLTSTDYVNTVGGNAGTQTYDLDILGNRNTYTDTRETPPTTIAYGANNPANEYSQVSLMNGSNGLLSYDPIGNLIQDEQGYQYDYDHENHLIEVRDQTGQTLATYSYDALGRRIIQDKENQTTIFYYDGQNVLAEFDDTDTRLRYYVHGSTYVDELVLLHEDGPTDADDRESFYLLGPNYSVVGLADATGGVIEAYNYDAFGNVTKEKRITDSSQDTYDFNQDRSLDKNDAELFALAFGSSTGDPNYDIIYDLDNDGIVALTDWQLWYDGYQDFQNSATSNPYYFTGRRLDFSLRDTSNNPTLSLYHYRARAYDAHHGRFHQRDPAGYVDGMNLYEFARGRPLSLLDPWGLFTIQQLIGRYGEQALVRAIQSNPAKYTILQGLGKSVAANGPDLIVYNIKDEVFEFIDNKAWKRKTMSNLPIWMKNFDVTKYDDILQGAINAGKIPLKNIEAYKKALRAAGSGGKVRLAITPFGGKVRGIGSSLAKRGIQFLDQQAIRSGARGTAARLCVLPIAAAAIEVLSNTQTAFAAEIYDPEPQAVFVEDLQAIMTKLVGGSTRYGSATKFHSNNEISSLRDDLIQRGIIISRSALGRFFSFDSNSFEWSENLTEQDLDYLITKLKVDQRADSLNAAIEVLGKKFEFSIEE